MRISLSPEMARFVEQKVRAGVYASPDDLIEDALRKMRISDEIAPIAGAELEKLIAVGQTDADAGRLMDGNQALQERRQRRAAGRGNGA